MAYGKIVSFRMRANETGKSVIRPIHLVAATRIKSQSAADADVQWLCVRFAENGMQRNIQWVGWISLTCFTCGRISRIWWLMAQFVKCCEWKFQYESSERMESAQFFTHSTGWRRERNGVTLLSEIWNGTSQSAAYLVLIAHLNFVRLMQTEPSCSFSQVFFICLNVANPIAKGATCANFRKTHTKNDRLYGWFY